MGGLINVYWQRSTFVWGGLAHYAMSTYHLVCRTTFHHPSSVEIPGKPERTSPSPRSRSPAYITSCGNTLSHRSYRASLLT